MCVCVVFVVAEMGEAITVMDCCLPLGNPPRRQVGNEPVITSCPSTVVAVGCSSFFDGNFFPSLVAACFMLACFLESSCFWIRFAKVSNNVRGFTLDLI